MISRVWSFCLRSRKEEERVHEEDKRTLSNGSSQLWNETEANERGNPERSKQHSKQPSQRHGMMHNQSMMHARFKYAWHGKVHKQNYKLSGAQYATPLHIDGTPHQLFSSLSVRYSTILNVG